MKPRSKKLNKTVDDFSVAMKNRLAEKEQEGFTGWDTSRFSTRNLLKRIEKKVARVDAEGSEQAEKHTIDIGALAMMIWWKEFSSPEGETK